MSEQYGTLLAARDRCGDAKQAKRQPGRLGALAAAPQSLLTVTKCQKNLKIEKMHSIERAR